MLNSFRSAKWFTTLDLASGYWQVEMHSEDIEKTAFITPFGLYEFLVMPFGLSYAPGTFQRLMNHVLQEYLGRFVAVYLDDVIIYSNGTFEQHLDYLHQVFETLRRACLKLKIKKCFFCFPNIHFLGHVVGRDGIRPDPEKIEKVKNYPVSINLIQLRATLGLFSYYRKFIKDFSRIARPINNLLKKDIPFKWTQKQQTAFEQLKEMLIKSPVLVYPDFEQPFILYTDASGTGLDAVLSQLQDDGKEHVIAYASRSLNQAEQNYSVTDQECLAIVWAIEYFHYYLELQPFEVVTDHSALKWLKTSKILKGRRARWMMKLQQYGFTIRHRPEKINTNADALSRMYEQEENYVECFLMEYTENSVSDEEQHQRNFKNKITELLNPIVEKLEENSEIEWEFSDDSPTISVKEDELVDWFYQRNICTKCGIPSEILNTRGNSWNAPRLCNICYEYEEQIMDSHISNYINVEQVEREYCSKLITQQGIVKMCENCGQIKRLNNIWENVSEVNYSCSLVGDKCYFLHEDHTHNICNECLEKRNYKGKSKRNEFLFEAKQFAHEQLDREEEKYIFRRNKREFMNEGLFQEKHRNYRNYCENCFGTVNSNSENWLIFVFSHLDPPLSIG